MRKLVVFILFGLCAFQVSSAQQVITCGSVEYIDELDLKFPGFKKNADEQYRLGIESIRMEALHKTPPLDTLFDIPVVFHVVYNNETENIPDSLIFDQMQVLNDAYNRRNADTINTREIFKPVAGNARISFHLAKTDPQGDTTTGITRTQTNMTSFYNGSGTIVNDFVKSRASGGAAAWDTERYLNIWVCDMTYNEQLVLLGYAFPPTNSSGWTAEAFVPQHRQGVVLHYGTVGRNNKRGPGSELNTAEKTAVHEVGHFLGLRHIWGDARNGQDGCVVDDYIDDTPVQASATIETFCPKLRNTCTTANDLPDQFENYMDYSRRECSNMFTHQQVKLMRYNLFNLRPNLGERTLIQAPGPDFDKTTVFPNPVGDAIQLNLVGPLDGEILVIRLYDVLGRSVLEREALSDDSVTWPVIGLAPGVYWLELESDQRGMLLAARIFKRD